MFPAPPAESKMPEWLHHRARLSPEQLALLCGDERWTFAELERRVAAVAGWLASRAAH